MAASEERHLMRALQAVGRYLEGVSVKTGGAERSRSPSVRQGRRNNGGVQAARGSGERPYGSDGDGFAMRQSQARDDSRREREVACIEYKHVLYVKDRIPQEYGGWVEQLADYYELHLLTFAKKRQTIQQMWVRLREWKHFKHIVSVHVADSPTRKDGVNSKADIAARMGAKLVFEDRPDVIQELRSQGIEVMAINSARTQHDEGFDSFAEAARCVLNRLPGSAARQLTSPASGSAAISTIRDPAREDKMAKAMEQVIQAIERRHGVQYDLSRQRPQSVEDKNFAVWSLTGSTKHTLSRVADSQGRKLQFRPASPNTLVQILVHGGLGRSKSYFEEAADSVRSPVYGGVLVATTRQDGNRMLAQVWVEDSYGDKLRDITSRRRR